MSKDNIYEIIILKPFEYWYKTPKRTKIAFGGRGGGKSESIARMLVAASFEIKGVILCARETQKSLEDSIKKVLEEIIIDYKLESYFRFTRTEIENKLTNCRFLFRGLRDSSVESIKSIKGVKICFVEEAQFLSEHSFKILKPSIREEGSEIWYAFNPRFPQDVIYNLIRVYKLEDKSYEAKKNREIKNYNYQYYEDDQILIYKINYDGNYFFSKVLETERLDTLKKYPQDYPHVWLGELDQKHGQIFFRDKIKFYDETDTELKKQLDFYVNYCLVDPAFGAENCYTSAIIYKKMAGNYYLVDSGLMRNDVMRTTDEILTEFMKRYNVKKVYCEGNFAQKELIKKLSRYFTVQPFYQKINKIDRIVNSSYTIFDKVIFPSSWNNPPENLNNIEEWINTIQGRGFIALQQLFNFSDIKSDNYKKGDPFSFVDFPDALTSIVMFDNYFETYESEEQRKDQGLLNNIFKEYDDEYAFDRSII